MAKFIPELVAPGGNLEKFKMAILYGADSVYISGEKFGLRTAADNFTWEDIKEAKDFASKRKKKVFVVLNAFLHDKDFRGFDEFIKYLDTVNVDGVIISDFGVIDRVKKNTRLNIHLSTQNTCLNSYAAGLCKEVGIRRIVLGREVSTMQAKKIKEKSGLEIEMFIHGSMCMSYSGNCVISNYTFNRDANRGGCKHSCRFLYDIQGKKDYFYSSKDLMGMRFLKEMSEAKIDALKIEGRMKTPHYLATVVKAYSSGLKLLDKLDPEQISELEVELVKVMTREAFDGNLMSAAGDDSVFRKNICKKKWDVAGIILEVIENKHILLNVRCPFNKSQALEVLTFEGDIIEIKNDELYDVTGEIVHKVKSGTIVKLPYATNVEKFNIVRVRQN